MAAKPKLYKNEENDLELHVSICHERYLQLDSRLGTLEDDVKSIKQEIFNSNRSLRTTIIATSGPIIVALIGLISFLVTK